MRASVLALCVLLQVRCAVSGPRDEQAAEVSSGRVGRTKTLTLDERAALAARAFIRHRYTDYEQQLAGLDRDSFLAEVNDFDYRQIKQAAHDAVDAYLEMHRHRLQ